MEAHDTSANDVVWDILKYIATGLLSIMSMVFLYIFGKYKNQHEQMYAVHQDRHGNSAIQLNNKLEEEKKEHLEDFDFLKKRVKQLEANYTKITSELNEVKKLIEHKDNNYRNSSDTMLKILMEIQDKLAI